MHIREEKRKKNIGHVGKKLSNKTQTLYLLDGVPYAPTTLSSIRNIVEGRKDIGKKNVGKRALYFRT